jgi:hypothetical protein
VHLAPLNPSTFADASPHREDQRARGESFGTGSGALEGAPYPKAAGRLAQASWLHRRGVEPQARASFSKEKSKTVLAKPKPTDFVFPNKPRELLNAILAETGLKRDRDGNPRTAYSLRHTYICFRLTEGAHI